MIRPININLNAAHPELKLLETVTYTGSPSSVFIRGIPPNYGRWAITAVFVAASFPDGSTTTRAAVRSADGVWVATLPATATSGRTENGFRVIADGIDENGEAVTGYIIAVADFAVASLDVTPAPEPGETSYQMLYFDEVPSTLRKGDVTKIDGVLKFYNGTAWESFAAPVTFDNAVTKDSSNGVKSSGIWSAIWGALSALPTGFSSLYDWCVAQLAGKMPSTATGADIAVSGTDSTKISAALAGKATKADATLNLRGPNHDGLSAWNVQPVYPAGYTGYTGPNWDDSYLLWVITFTGHPINPDVSMPAESGNTRSSLSITFVNGTTATRTALPGYQLGSQTDKPLASETEAEALRDGKLDKRGGTMTGSLTEKHGLVLGKEVNNDFDGFRVDANGNAEMTSHAGGSAMIGAVITAAQEMPNKANRAANPTAGNLAALDANGNPTDAGWTAGALARYSLVTKTITNGAVSLDDRASNAVTISATLSPNTLTINFPTATSGKVRDFAMRLNIAAGVTAPEIAWPQGVTLENNGGEVPEIADGGTGGSSTILYFSETENDGTTAKFLVKGETLTAIAQA